MACSNRLTSNINDGCNSDSVKGFEQKAFIYNWDDIDHSFKNLDYLASFLIQSNTGYPIYLYGEKPFEGTKRELEKGKYNNTFMEVAAFALLADNPANAAAVQAMSKGRWVLMFEKTSGAGWTIYGLENGLKAETKVSDIYGEAAWEVTLASKGNYFSSMFLSPTYPAPWNIVTPEVLLTEYAVLPFTVATSGQFTASVLNGGTPTGKEIIIYVESWNSTGYHGTSIVTDVNLPLGAHRMYLDKATTHLTLNKDTTSNISGALDFSLFENLIKIDCGGNIGLTSVNVSKNINLADLEVSPCSLTSLDISSNAALTLVGIAYNNISPTALKNTIVGLVQGKAAAGKTQTTTVYVAGNPNVANLWAEDWEAIITPPADMADLVTKLAAKYITLVWQ